MFKLLLYIFLSIFFIIPSAYANNYKTAEKYIQNAVSAPNTEQSFEYLHKANDLLLEEYEKNSDDTKVLIALSKIRQFLGDRKEAKVYIMKAYGLNPLNPDIQKEVGDFFYNFQDYCTAIEYYKLSLASGNLEDINTNLQTAKCYEKLGDKENARLYYKICAHLSPYTKYYTDKFNEDENRKKQQIKLQMEKEEQLKRDEKEIEEIINKMNNFYVN